MRPADVLEQVRHQPFVPLLIRLSNGREYLIRHPDLILVGRSTLHIGNPAPDLPPGVYDSTDVVSLLHVAQIIPQPGVAAPGGNGATG
jgi:hypothetical protein